jgi:succinylglutamate desuccinylase
MIIENDAMIPSVIRITENARGPRVVLFGGVHGDELSGVHAVEKLFFDLFVGTRTLRQGSLSASIRRSQSAATQAANRPAAQSLLRAQNTSEAALRSRVFETGV